MKKSSRLKEHPLSKETVHGLARRSLFSFLVTFLAARVDVFLIMSHNIPNLYLFMGKTHVHHLNYGIFLLSAVAGYSVFRRPQGRAAEWTALLYGVALGLTFDEFGMWLHLGGSYWQRASVDAVIAVAALIGLFAFASTLRKFEVRHLWAFLGLALLVALFVWTLFIAGDRLGDKFGATLEELEASSSP